MNSDQKIGVALLIGLVGFALALGLGRKPAVTEPDAAAELTTAEAAFETPIAIEPNPFAPDPTLAADELPPRPPGDPFAPAAEPATEATLESGELIGRAFDRPAEGGIASEGGPAARSDPPTAAVSGSPQPSFRNYIVRSGDTLSGIAERECGRVGSYLDLYEANTDVLESPNDLRVGQTLRIPERLAVSGGGVSR